jgi:16S rRNA A1518/A1519 N6-dimethyltransferase RsmA/KsgA/DIM1 with predicted DNA glycosylase/AP lyase activity
LLEEPPPPLKAVAARVTQHKTFLRKTFPELWRSIRARFVQRKKMAESERREFLYRAVRTVVAELSVLGIRPTPGLVLSRLKDSPLRSLATIGEAIREALAANAG